MMELFIFIWSTKEEFPRNVDLLFDNSFAFDRKMKIRQSYGKKINQSKT